MDLVRVAGDKSVPREIVRLQSGTEETGLRNNGLVWRKTSGGVEYTTVFLIGTSFKL